MVKKIFLNRQRAVAATEQRFVRSESGANILFINNSVLDETVQLHFTIFDVTSKSFPKLNATGCTLLIKFNSPGEEEEPTSYPGNELRH